MSLDAVRAALVTDARAEAAAWVAKAETEATHRLQEAREDAASQVSSARAEAMAEADEQLATARAAVGRQARRAVLEARARARVLLVRETIAALRAQRDSTEYKSLVDALARRARTQLGPDAAIRDSRSGGVTATADRRSVDYSLPAIVERVVDALGPEIEQLWR